jgi:hypothetical protein
MRADPSGLLADLVFGHFQVNVRLFNVSADLLVSRGRAAAK